MEPSIAICTSEITIKLIKCLLVNTPWLFSGCFYELKKIASFHYSCVGSPYTGELFDCNSILNHKVFLNACTIYVCSKRL